MDTEKTEWIDSIMRSIDYIEKAKAPDHLFELIHIERNTPVIAFPKIILSIAAAVLIIMLNLFVIKNIINKNRPVEELETLYSTEGQSIISNYNLYES